MGLIYSHPDAIFDHLMSLDKSRTTWDSEFINGSVVESVGEFDELVEIKMKNPVSTLFFGFAQPFSPDKLFDLQFTIQNLRLKRSWIRDRDGGFTIALANVVDANVCRRFVLSTAKKYSCN